jgi:hypothetical protein
MSLIWALISLENEICVKYFDVVSLDDCDRPQVIKPLDYGIRGVISPFSMYSNEKLGNSDQSILPVVLDNGNELVSDIEIMKQQGWEFPNQQSDDINNSWQPL